MPKRLQPAPGSGLHQCLFCHGDYVIPVLIEAVDDARWRVVLRCGECETYRDVVIVNEVAERFNQDYERGIAELAATSDRLERERMATELHVLVIALQLDLIDAADFAPR
ncbi:MAG: hypothetical protein M3N56_06930 [Actinomycetota bacterium]|nr:hypothetical protein [Actinomycetota bacterium]